MRLRGGEGFAGITNRTALWRRVAESPVSPDLERLRASLEATVKGSWEAVVKTIVDLYHHLSERTHMRGRPVEEYQLSVWEVDIWKGVVSARFADVLKCLAEFIGIAYRVRDADAESVFFPREGEGADAD